MKIYYRILNYVGPLKQHALGYFCATLLSVVFGLATYSLVIPLLNVLFNQETLSDLVLEKQNMPPWKMGIDYFTQRFHYYFLTIIINYGKIKALCFLSLLFTLSNIISNVFRYIADMTMAKVRINVVYNLRLMLFKKMVHFPISYFSDTKKGDLIARMTTDIQEIEHAVADTLRVFFKEPTQFFCYIIVLCNLSLKLTFFTLFFLPIAGWIIAEIIKRLQKLAHESQKSLGNLISLIEETLTSIRIIKIFNAQQYVTQKFQASSRAYALTNTAVARKQYLTAPLSSSLGIVVVSIILAYGGNLILLGSNALTASTFIAYIIICFQTLIPIKMISTSISHIQKGIASGRRIFDLLDTPLTPKVALNSLPKTTFNHAIVFKNVSFGYTAQRKVLHNISCTIHKGETIALVGASGSGKSTLLALLSGLYQPSSGVIEIDGLPLSQISEETLHCLMGIVTQEPILFHDTIYNNITFNRTTATTSAVLEATQLAFAHDFIMALPQQYETIVGTNGDKLSGGQKQRICMARALLHHPPILVLDEATSALDTAAERSLQEGLQSLIHQRTSIIVAHRLSTICHVDKIIVLEEGKIIEQGTHASLLEQGGVYKKLFLLQQ
ncbi:MAG: ABC transporter ATP-binding protein/permease [Amoebophilaceae bacterium]|nr:ABC transporter ATP-binding protein/permease [Amoebophilaceae bacterium]